MKKHSPSNERIKRQYFIFLKEAKRQSEASVDAVAKALSRFEEHSKYRVFKAFHFQQAVAFKKHMAGQKGQQSGKPLSKATMHSTLGYLKCFFQWLAVQPGYKSRLQYSDAEYFNMSEKDTRIATARREKPVPTLEQIKHVIASMPTDSEIELRNRALIAFTLLTGARDSAIASMKLKHVDLSAGSVFQDAREVKTKFSKTFTTYFFPVGDDVRHIIEAWVKHLRKEKLWGNDDPLFPSTNMGLGANNHFEAIGLKRDHWRSAAPIRSIFRDAFARAGLPYFNPHSFRNTLVQLGETNCRTPEDCKTWSQNLGHEKVLTTFYCYGEVSGQRQGEIIHGLASPKDVGQSDSRDLLKELARKLNISDVSM